MIGHLFSNRRGATSMEFGIIGVFIFMVTFGVFDVGRYALVLHSLSDVAEEAARQQIICYSPYIANSDVNQAVCPSDPVTNKLAIAPFLTGLAPTVTTTAGSPHVVTASATFSMIMGIWPAAMNNPSVSVSLPF